MAIQYLDSTGLAEYTSKIKENFSTSAISNEDIDSLVDGLDIGLGGGGGGGSSFTPGGSATDIILGDGTVKSIADFITENAEAIRDAIGLATTAHMGLVPQLPTS